METIDLHPATLSFYNDCGRYVCPKCSFFKIIREHKYCPFCGSKINWIGEAREIFESVRSRPIGVYPLVSPSVEESGE